MKRVVVLGGGVGGVSAAYELKDKLGAAHEIVLVSDLPHFEFTPSNPWVAVKWRKPDAIRVALDPVMTRKGVVFRHDPVTAIEPGANRLALASGEALDYDYLVIASGPRLAFDEIPGLGPEGHTASVCKTDHAAAAAEQVEALCRQPGPVTGGATCMPANLAMEAGPD